MWFWIIWSFVLLVPSKQRQPQRPISIIIIFAPPFQYYTRVTYVHRDYSNTLSPLPACKVDTFYLDCLVIVFLRIIQFLSFFLFLWRLLLKLLIEFFTASSARNYIKVFIFLLHHLLNQNNCKQRVFFILLQNSILNLSSFLYDGSLETVLFCILPGFLPMYELSFCFFCFWDRKKGVQLVLKAIAVQFVLELIYLLQELHGKKKWLDPIWMLMERKKEKRLYFE